MNEKPRKKLKPPAMIAVLVGAVLLLGALGWFVLVRPQGAKLRSLQHEQKQVQRKIDEQRQQTAAAQGVPQIRVADLYRLAKAMPNKPDMPDLLLELSQLARDSGIEFDSISPATPIAVTGYQAIPITVTFDGNFFTLSDFLYRLRTLVDVHDSRLDATGRLFTVDSISFTEGPSQFPSIRATLLINAYVYGSRTGAAGVTPGPTAGGTETTTTGTTTTTSTETTSTSTTTTPTTTSPTASASAAEGP